MADVVDNPQSHRFELEEGGHRAELVYRLDEDRLILVHTGVPDELARQGIGGRLVEASVARAAAEGLTVVPQCSFARAWLEGHPEAAGSVRVG